MGQEAGASRSEVGGVVLGEWEGLGRREDTLSRTSPAGAGHVPVAGLQENFTALLLPRLGLPSLLWAPPYFHSLPITLSQVRILGEVNSPKVSPDFLWFFGAGTS